MLLLIFSYSKELLNNQNSSVAFLIVRLITFIFLFLIVIGGAYFTTKYISGKNRSFMQQKNLKVIERISLGVDKSIYLINLENQYYLLTTTKNNIGLIDKFDKESINIVEQLEKNNGGNMVFNDYFKKYLKNQKDLNKEKVTLEKSLNTNLIKKLVDIKTLNKEIKGVEEAHKDENK